MLTFFVFKTLVVFRYIHHSTFTHWFEYLSVIGFMPPFFIVVREFLYRKRKTSEQLDKQINDFTRFEEFVNTAAIVTKADKRAKITYVNKKFEDVAGWKLEEVVGKDHIIVNSNTQPRKYWKGMYDTVHKGKIWHDVVTNRAKNGELYYVDTYIKATFDKHGEVDGYTSIRQDVTDIVKATEEIAQKNIYLEHAAKIIRHDMHSGINTYLPRGIKSLQRRLSQENIDQLKIAAPLKLIEDGLHHAQKVYNGVYEFTNLVKDDAVLNKKECNVKDILDDYLRLTAYRQQVLLDYNLPTALEINEALFCTAIDNLIRNGLKYNDSDTKWVRIYKEDLAIVVEDNGRGISQEEFIELSKPYKRKEGQKESGTGLGLNITIEILKEHGFKIRAEKTEVGTKIYITLQTPSND